jgi:glutamate 5-kinase
MSKPILVLKFGTASITKTNGEPDEAIIADIAQQVAILHKNYRIVIVSSGAVGAGKHFIQHYEGEISQRKAAAAIGNPILIGIYSKYFAKFGIAIAQSLCERQHFGNREQFLQLKQTYQALWENNIIPIANENDVVSSRELKFSDNDELATLIAVGFEANCLMLCTSVGGFLDQNGQVVKRIDKIDEQVMALVDNSKSALGLGGMTSKLTFTRLANRMGIKVVIFGMNTEQGILNGLNGNVGSTFMAQESSISARNKWLASGGMAVGKVQIDAGASRALQNRNSLLAVGVENFEGEFESNEIIEIVAQNGEMLAIAKSKCSSEELKSNLKTQNFEVANASDIVLM